MVPSWQRRCRRVSQAAHKLPIVLDSWGARVTDAALVVTIARSSSSATAMGNAGRHHASRVVRQASDRSTAGYGQPIGVVGLARSSLRKHLTGRWAASAMATASR